MPPAEPITLLDSEVDVNNVTSNLILVGGPVANSVTAYLVDQGLSTVDWTASEGDLEYIENAFGDYDVLIVAGKAREYTRAAAEELMSYLKDLA
ncbi:S-layer protein, partial [Palaeococcus sp. (in: euryarchaeotes)]